MFSSTALISASDSDPACSNSENNYSGKTVFTLNELTQLHISLLFIESFLSTNYGSVDYDDSMNEDNFLPNFDSLNDLPYTLSSPSQIVEDDWKVFCLFVFVYILNFFFF
jgi:hypothetical protein